MKIVLTGSSSGIGKFLADNLTENGHNVCRLSRSPQPGFAMRCDVSNWGEISACASQLAQQWDFIDGIICCAGIQGPIGPAMETDPVQWKTALAINLDGTFLRSAPFIPCFAAHRAARKSFACPAVVRPLPARILRLMPFPKPAACA
jgi:NAD(P)-dependent dehydrogenase (short-subunit alcohol dehydrogenase family)